jgi:hypothetical protein
MPWRPMKLPSKTWEEAAKVYKTLESTSAAFEAMRALCEHVAHAPYKPLVFCAQSMHALLVAQQPELEWNCGVLRIEVSREGLLVFALHEQPFIEPAAFLCAPQDLIPTFESFLRKTKWVSEATITAR